MPDKTAQNPAGSASQIQKFTLVGVALCLLFIWPLCKLLNFAFHDELFSYVILIPFVSVYLAWLRREQLSAASLPGKKIATFFLIAGSIAVAGSFLRSGSTMADRLVLPMLALLLFLNGAGFWVLGRETMRVLAFPFALLIFMVPFPDVMTDAIQTWLQYGSAVVAGWMFAISGMTVFHDKLFFHLPSVTLQVAPECSGIHSTIVLFIVSLVAAHFFLRTPWKCVILCLVVIPLALLRNGFRVFVLGELCEHISPAILDSPIHHHGGPLFFALSLIPFSLLLYFLMKSERSKVVTMPPDARS